MCGTQRIVNAIEELESNGLATRSWALAGLCLSLCQRCSEWTGSGCPHVSEKPGKFAEFLVDAERKCPKWTECHAEDAPDGG